MLKFVFGLQSLFKLYFIVNVKFIQKDLRRYGEFIMLQFIVVKQIMIF